MSSESSTHIISNFFRDGAKIIFGSLVVGVFVPSGAITAFPWLTFVTGIMATGMFLVIASITTKKAVR
ncbi:MAG: hypothetical protein AAB533_03210 [Patescibacteria group bacterium]